MGGKNGKEGKHPHDTVSEEERGRRSRGLCLPPEEGHEVYSSAGKKETFWQRKIFSVGDFREKR